VISKGIHAKKNPGTVYIGWRIKSNLIIILSLLDIAPGKKHVFSVISLTTLGKALCFEYRGNKIFYLGEI